MKQVVLCELSLRRQGFSSAITERKGFCKTDPDMTPILRRASPNVLGLQIDSTVEIDKDWITLAIALQRCCWSMT